VKVIALLLAATVSSAVEVQDGLTLHVGRGTNPGQVALTWTAGAAAPYTVYRVIAGVPESSPANIIGTTSLSSWTDTPPAGGVFFYRVVAQPVWKRDVTSAPVDAQSSTIIANLAAAGGFGNGRLQIDFSIVVLTADAATPYRTFTPIGDFYTPDCDQVPVPVPAGGALEGESGYSCAHDGDCHLIVRDPSTNDLYEMWRADITNGVFRGGCLAVWDLDRIYPPAGRGEQCTSADAAGYPIAPLLFTADEVKAGAIQHAIRFILPNARIRQGEYVHPATHGTSAAKGPSDAPPYGTRLRLRKDFPVDTLPPGARVVARAMQRHGMLLADGGNVALTAQSDRFTQAKWSGLLGPLDLSSLRPSDFEMVAAGPRIPLTLDCVRNP